MRQLFYLLALITLICFGTAPVFAEGENVNQPDPLPIKINKGNWEIGGEGNYFRSNDGELRSLTLSPRAEYFILNRFSVGGRLAYVDSSQAPTEVRIGPGFTWYVMQISRTVFYYDQSILLVKPSGNQQNYFAGDSGLGVDFFLSPSVAVGPSLRGLYYFGGDSAVPKGGMGFRIGLSVFL